MPFFRVPQEEDLRKMETAGTVTFLAGFGGAFLGLSRCVIVGKAVSRATISAWL